MQEQKRSESAQPTKAQRYGEILATFARHGIGIVGDRFGKKDDEREHSRAEHVRRACEELGTTFIKLGQALSTRGDLLPEPYRTELLKLQDDVPAVPGTAAARVIREELGASPEKLFASFDREAMGSASIGQVHAAKLKDGRDVVVKVRKPGVEQIVEIDLDILQDLAESWSERFPILEEYDVRGLVREFADTLRSELDYRREAANVRFFRDVFAKEHGFNVPEVIEEYSGERVITLARLDGRKPTDLQNTGKRRRATLSRRIARLVLEPAFERGVFYADPHAGNFLIQSDGSLAVIDFGMVGRLTPEARRRVADVFIAIDRRDAQRLSDSLIEITSPTHPVDRAVINTELDRMLERYVDVALEDVRFGEAISQLLELIRRHGLRLPGNLAQFFKALAMSEGLLQTIDPDSSLADYIEPMVGKLMYQRFAGDQLLDRMRDSAVDAAELSIELPRRIDRVLGEVERGNLRVWTKVQDLDSAIARFEHAVERANAAMLASACIVGLAIVMLFYHPQGWQRWIGIAFWIGVTLAFLFALRTVWAALAKKHKR
jgi:ubiquinone biosynthesis protein